MALKGIKRKTEQDWKKYAAFFALLLLLVTLSNSLRKAYNKKAEAEEALALMQAELEALEARQAELGSSIESLGTPDGLALEMRRKLNVAGAGESVAIIVDDQKPEPEPEPERSAWQRFKDFVVGIFR